MSETLRRTGNHINIRILDIQENYQSELIQI